MSIEAGLFNLLSTTPAIVALCETRIYPDVAERSAMHPLIVYEVISADPDPTMDTSGYQVWRYQFTCVAPTAAAAMAIFIALRQTLEGFRGTLSDGTVLQDAQFRTFRGQFDHDELVYERIAEFYLSFTFSS